MIAQVLLSLGLTACLVYVLSLGRSVPIVRFGLLAIVAAGYLFIWMPELTNEIARLVGIGRGADLMMYLWILLSLFLILKLHIKLRELSEMTTKLARAYTLTQQGEID